MLRRLGNKRKLLAGLLGAFPERVNTFVDLFMGTGAVSFAMLNRAKYIIANDNDAEIFNLFLVLKERKEDLRGAIALMPQHEALFLHWKTHKELDPVWQAARFLMLSNFSYLGGGETPKFDNADNGKALLLRKLEEMERLLAAAPIQFLCCDFRDALKKIHWKHARDIAAAFLYLDPPYLGTEGNYGERRSVKFVEEDTLAVFDVALESGMRFALSEFAHPFVLDQAKKYGLHVSFFGERQTLKSRQTEILITNYEPKKRQMALFGD